MLLPVGAGSFPMVKSFIIGEFATFIDISLILVYTKRVHRFLFKCLCIVIYDYSMSHMHVRSILSPYFQNWHLDFHFFLKEISFEQRTK